LIKNIIVSSSSRIRYSISWKRNFPKRSPCTTVSDWPIVQWYLALVNFSRCSKATRQIKGGR